MMTSPDDIAKFLQESKRLVADAPVKGHPDYWPHRTGTLIAHLEFALEDIKAAIPVLTRSRSPEARAALANLRSRIITIDSLLADDRRSMVEVLEKARARQ
jgi:hypothetical protein